MGLTLSQVRRAMEAFVGEPRMAIVGLTRVGPAGAARDSAEQKAAHYQSEHAAVINWRCSNSHPYCLRFVKTVLWGLIGWEAGQAGEILQAGPKVLSP